MNKSNRAAQFAFLALGVCILITASIALQRSRSRQLSHLRSVLTQKQSELEDGRAKAKELPALEARYAGLTQQVAILEPNLPTEAYIPTFLAQIQTLAVQTHNRLTLIKPEPKRKMTAASAAPQEDVVSADKKAAPSASAAQAPAPPSLPYDQIGLEVGMEGTYWSALDFLEKLRAFPKMIAVNEMSIKPNRQGSQGAALSPKDPPLEISLKLTAVMAKEK
jgi:Tfp pilus assembly protein PilO